MSRFDVICALAVADFFERVRRHSFYFTLGFAGLLSSAVYTQRIVLRLGDYRGVYNSAWFGALMALTSTLFLSLAGFYIVKNSIERDEQNKVGQILAATIMTKTSYTYGKALSNFLVLISLVSILAVSALLMQLLRGTHTIDFWPLFSPFLFATLPVMAFVAGLAVLFETTPLLRGGVGNAFYVFLWIGVLSASITLPKLDPFALNSYMRSMQAAVLQINPGYRPGFSFQVGAAEATQQFEWSGLHWSFMMVLMRLVWVGIALLLPAVAAYFFNRFDPAAQRRSSRNQPEPESTNAEPAIDSTGMPNLTAISPLPSRPKPITFVRLTLPQLRLALKSASRWWYVIAMGLFIVSVATPVTISLNFLPFVWIWPLLLWSQMGTREHRYLVFPLLFSSANIAKAYVPAVWLGGFIIALITGGGTAVRLLQSGDGQGLFTWAVAACFIPSLAVCLGVLTSTATTFEAVYTVWWYIGPLSHSPYLDFMSTPSHTATTYVYLFLAAGLVSIAYVRRQLQERHA
jgi:hypothetical protein